MATQNHDINSLLTIKVKGISAAGLDTIKKDFSNSPLVLSFLEFLLRQKREKFNTAEAVFSLYKVKQTAGEYGVFENRFFKLRKKLYDYFNATPPEVHPVFTPQEIQLHEIKTLSVEGKYQEILPLLQDLEARLWRENVFELLPEVLEIYIHTNQVLKLFKDNDALFEKMDLVQVLIGDIIEAKKIARKIYEANLIGGLKATLPYLQKLQRLSINRNEYPRFKLIYNVVSAIHKLGGGGLEYRHDPKITNRFIAVINKIHEQHPTMPDYKFSAGYIENQSYLFKNLAIMNHFNGLEFREAAVRMTALYNLVMEPNSTMKRMRGPVFFSSTCMIQNAGRQHAEALQTAKDYLHFQKEIKQEQNIHKAYAEIVNAHIWLYPTESGYSDEYILEKLDQIIKTEQSNHPYFYAQASWMKVRWLLLKQRYDEAEKLFVKNDIHNCFTEKKITAELQNTISTLKNKKNDKAALEKQLQAVHNLKLKCVVPPDHMHCMFLEKVLELNLRKVK
jgi:hypothetical protein